MQEMSNDPIQTAIEEIEKGHERDKEGTRQIEPPMTFFFCEIPQYLFNTRGIR